MAVIRKTDDKLEYLELQSNVTNGFKNLTKRTLKDRFKCKGNNGKYASPSHLIDVESLLTNNNFEKVLPYINTLSDRQLKGVEGGEK